MAEETLQSLFDDEGATGGGGVPAEDVRPERWSNITVLFDDGVYSVISGTYEYDGGSGHRIGERWNGSPNHPRGYPTRGQYPVWYNAPEFLEYAILHGILDELVRNPNNQQPERGIAAGMEAQERISRVMRELVAQVLCDQ